MKTGPNVRRLIAEKIARDAIPKGGGIGDALGFLSSKEKIIQASRSATTWIEAAIAAVKAAPDNPYGSDDELIAGEILRKIQERRTK